MARAAGITMEECRHFMTRRFDRTAEGGKLHMQSLAALAHYDFNMAGAYGNEQALLVIRQLGLGIDAVEEMFRRMCFNIVAHNQDDHVKNIAFLMGKAGRWSLAPAYDIVYAYNPEGRWTGSHQMTLQGKRDGFTLEDFKACGETAGMKRGRYKTILAEVRQAVARWKESAESAGVTPAQTKAIDNALRIVS